MVNCEHVRVVGEVGNQLFWARLCCPNCGNHITRKWRSGRTPLPSIDYSDRYLQRCLLCERRFSWEWRCVEL